MQSLGLQLSDTSMSAANVHLSVTFTDGLADSNGIYATTGRFLFRVGEISLRGDTGFWLVPGGNAALPGGFGPETPLVLGKWRPQIFYVELPYLITPSSGVPLSALLAQQTAASLRANYLVSINGGCCDGFGTLTLQSVVVPDASTLTLLAPGLAAAGVFTRRRRLRRQF